PGFRQKKCRRQIDFVDEGYGFARLNRLRPRFLDLGGADYVFGRLAAGQADAKFRMRVGLLEAVPALGVGSIPDLESDFERLTDGRFPGKQSQTGAESISFDAPFAAASRDRLRLRLTSRKLHRISFAKLDPGFRNRARFRQN